MFDAWDILLLIGLLLITAGIAFIYWPLALVFAGAAVVAIYVVREYANNVPVASDSEGEQ